MAQSMAQGPLERYEWSEWCDRADNKARGKSKTGGREFYGEPLAQALKMARGEGYITALPDAERFAERVAAEVQLETTQAGFRSAFDVTGAEVDVARYLSGEPECMVQSEPIRIAKQGRAVRIVIPGAYPSGTPDEQIRNRGAAIVALAQILARAQHPLEVWLGFCNHGDRYRHSYMVRVQQANEPLDEGRLMYALAHKTSNRRLCFSVKERGIYSGDICPGYGSFPRTVFLSDLPDEQANTIIVEDFDKRGDWSEPKAIAWIISTLETLGLV